MITVVVLHFFLKGLSVTIMGVPPLRVETISFCMGAVDCN